MNHELASDILSEDAGAFSAVLPSKKRIGQTDLSLRADPDTYRETLHKLQKELQTLPERLKRAGLGLIVVFEGWDASGKGGCIRRITDAIREDRFQVISTAAPTAEEKARHYLWRFWRTIPPYGSVTIYDRSWYGRVLVERVEQFTAEEDWRRAYDEINAFEKILADNRYQIVKFWMDISEEEQLRRFEARMTTPEKRDKLTAEDWRNRNHRDGYVAATADMFDLTDTEYAPWEIVPAEDKKFARLFVIQKILDSLPGGCSHSFPRTS